MARPLRLVKRILLSLASVLLIAALAGASYRWYADRNDIASTPPPGQLVDAGGHRLHIWCSGPVDPSTPTVIIDSGLGGGAFSWARIIPEVAKFAQVCTYDRAGMGYSDSGPTPRRSSQIASELAALIENSDISRPVILVGFSIGGYNTRIVASERPDLVAGLVLISPSNEGGAKRRAEAGIPPSTPPAALRMLLRAAVPLGIPRLLGLTFATPPERAPPEVREYVRATIYRASRYYAMGDELDAAGQSGLDVAAARRPLTIPLVILSPGRDDPRSTISRELDADVVTLSSRGCQVVVEGAGHGIGNNEIIIQAIRDTVLAAGDATSKPGC